MSPMGAAPPPPPPRGWYCAPSSAIAGVQRPGHSLAAVLCAHQPPAAPWPCPGQQPPDPPIPNERAPSCAPHLNAGGAVWGTSGATNGAEATDETPLQAMGGPRGPACQDTGAAQGMGVPRVGVLVGGHWCAMGGGGGVGQGGIGVPWGGGGGAGKGSPGSCNKTLHLVPPSLTGLHQIYGQQ